MTDLQTPVQGTHNLTVAEAMRLSASVVNRDAMRYEYIINCDYLAAKKHIPLLDEAAYKSMLRCKHDKEMAA